MKPGESRPVFGGCSAEKEAGRCADGWPPPHAPIGRLGTTDRQGSRERQAANMWDRFAPPVSHPGVGTLRSPCSPRTRTLERHQVRASRACQAWAFRGTGTRCNPLIPHGLFEIGFVWYFSLLRWLFAPNCPCSNCSGISWVPNHIVPRQSKAAPLLSELRCFE